MPTYCLDCGQEANADEWGTLCCDSSTTENYDEYLDRMVDMAHDRQMDRQIDDLEDRLREEG